jgi:hypothetical protein
MATVMMGAKPNIRGEKGAGPEVGPAMPLQSIVIGKP